MPYRSMTPQGPLLPLWGVYTRCTVPMLRIPDVPPEALIYFSLGAAPFVDQVDTARIDAALARLQEPQRTSFRKDFGIDELAGTVVRVEPDRTTYIRRLTPDEAHELEEAFVASHAVESPALETDDNLTGEYCESVYVGGWFGARPFQVRYAGMLPYRLVGADARAWARFLAVLHRLANTRRP